MAHNLRPMVFLPPTRPASEPQVGDLLTVKLAFGKTSGARLERIDGGCYFVKLVGLGIPEPYELGDRFPIDRAAITDWGRA
jgi:hypothetical protein